jgi:type IV secretion system protein VirB10
MSEAIERGASPVAGRAWFGKRSWRLVFYGLGCLLLLFLWQAVMAIMNPSVRSKPDDTGSAFIGQQVVNPPIPSLVKEKLAPETSPQPPAVVNSPTAPAEYTRFPSDGGENYFAQETVTDKVKDAIKGDGAKEPEKTRVDFKASTLPGGKAGPAMRLTYTMMPQMLPCILDTAMDSSLAGGIECHLAQDILSPEHVLLMPAGTRIVGTYKNDVKQGQARLFSFAGNAITQEGIPVPLDSQITDGVGRAGIPGEVDNHYFERFGAAIILGVADAALQLGQTELSKAGQSNINVGTGAGGLSSLASQILQQTINMPPTIYVQPGAQISIMVDHPVDFSDALRVSPRER